VVAEWAECKDDRINIEVAAKTLEKILTDPVTFGMTVTTVDV
jgi:hypothetical protein